MKRPQRQLHIIALSLLLCSIGSHSVFAASDKTAELIKKGQYLATAADCTACHTASKGSPFAGGNVISSPVGDIIATNITPSDDYGIGHYSEQQFADAVRKGVRADGANLYPAMPYTSYANFTDLDIHALYTYFKSGVTAVDKPTAQTHLPFPLNLRFSMMFWNALFLQKPGYQPDPAQSEDWNRGRYLAEGATHCSTCHTPRGFLMQEESNKALTGAQVGPWYAPNITNSQQDGIGSWSHEQLVTYLRTGRIAGQAQAAGSMAEAIIHSFQHLNDADLAAIATYIQSVAEKNPQSSAPSRMEQGKPGNALSSFRGTQFSAPTDEEGARLFSGNCASCHGNNGQGTADKFYPNLFHNSTTGADNPSNLIATILYGVKRDTAEGNVFMPPFGKQSNALNSLSDQQVATLSNWLLHQYGNPAVKVTPDRVAETRRGDPTSPLVWIAQAGVAAGAVVVIVLLGYLLWWRKRKRA